MFPLVSVGIVVRMVYALVTAFLICVVLSPSVIRKLAEKQMGQAIRDEGVQSHKAKAGIPTMGGIVILVAIVVSTIVWSAPRPGVMAGLAALVILGLVGFADDFLKVIHRRPDGLSARWKLAAQVGFGLGLWGSLEASGMPPTLYVPLLKTQVPLGLAYALLVVLVVCGASNAVNLTDGLDGLAAGVVLIVALCYAGIAYVSGHAIYARYLGVPHIRDAGELAVLCAAMAGACIGFLWYNAFPAAVFMGDTGSLALGGALGTVAVLVKAELLLVVIGGIFVIEALSVILQVASFKLWRRRIFKMSPIHHHFEIAGWPEPKVVIRFWIVTLMLALTGISILGVGARW